MEEALYLSFDRLLMMVNRLQHIPELEKQVPCPQGVGKTCGEQAQGAVRVLEHTSAKLVEKLASFGSLDCKLVVSLWADTKLVRS